jgi:hypothetical protein
MQRNLITGLGSAAVALASLSGVAISGPATFEQAKQLSTSTKKPLLLDFYAQW